MIKLKAMLAGSLLLLGVTANAQEEFKLEVSKEGKMGDYTEWTKKELVFGDGTKASVEYRMGLYNRKGIACYYNVEVKNTSDIKLKVKAKNHYYDKLVKRNFSEEAEESVKPGNTVVLTSIAQGCKKEKDAPDDRTDYQHCTACEFYVNLSFKK